MSTFDLDDDLAVWVPPTDAEQKVIEARRERNNKISRIMGQYLLKGYKMLAISCNNCNCILLEDKGKKKYCIGCSEVDDGDTIKDNPAVNEEAARKTVEENQHRNTGEAEQTFDDKIAITTSSSTSAGECTVQCVPSQSTEVFHNNKNCKQDSLPSNNTKLRTSINTDNRLTINDIDLTQDINNAVDTLRSKLVWATKQLQDSQGIHESKQLASLITETSSALLSLKNLVSQ